jgi:hypothetical protein
MLLAACLTCVCAAGAQAGPVALTIHGGRVTLVAHSATVRQILGEWSRVGRTTIVNLERIPGGPVSIELHDVTEEQALAVVLRTLGGFMAAPRAAVDPQASLFDRIVVMPVIATAAVPPPTVVPRQAAFPPAARRLRDPDTDQMGQEDENASPDREPGAPPDGERQGRDPSSAGGSDEAGSGKPPQSSTTPGTLSPTQSLRPVLPAKPGGDLS